MEWYGIESAPKNPEGKPVGPWILIYREYDDAIFQARWEYYKGRAIWKCFGIDPKEFYLPAEINIAEDPVWRQKLVPTYWTKKPSIMTTDFAKKDPTEIDPNEYWGNAAHKRPTR